MWKLRVEEVDGQPALVFPEDLLSELGVSEGDELHLEFTSAGMLLKVPAREKYEDQ